MSAVAVADLHLSDIPQPSAPASAGVAVGDTFYFARTPDDRTANGAFLWKSDGTPAGTQVVTELNRFDDASNFFEHNGTVYFAQSPDTGSGAVELWKTDGTRAGTVPVRQDLTNPLGGILPDMNLTAVGGTLYFTLGGLWKTDGTTNGTVRLTTNNAYSPFNSNGTLYFLTSTGLWKSNGTSAGTVQVKALPQTFYTPSDIVLSGGVMYFVRDGDLYRSDGTADGTVRHFDSIASLRDSAAVVTASGRVLFTGYAAGDGEELFATDGTAEGTTLLKSIRPGVSSAGIGGFIVAGDAIYFMADDGVHGPELWRSDGTEAGTAMVADLLPGAEGSSPSRLTAHDGRLYFAATHPALGRELFVTGAGVEGVRAAGDVYPGAAGSTPQLVIGGDSKVLFTALHPADGYSAFLVDAPDAAPTLLADLIPGLLNKQTPIAGTNRGDVFYAAGDAAPSGREPHVVSPAGTGRLAADLEPGPAGSDPLRFVPLGEQVIFRAVNAAAGTEVWRADAGGVSVLEDVIPPNPYSASVGIAGPFGDRAFINYTYFPVDNQPGVQELWTTQGTEETTRRLRSGAIGEAAEMGGWIYYLNNTGVSAALLRMSPDGQTHQSVKALVNIAPSGTSNIARDLRAVGGLLYFSVIDANRASRSLWRSDGTEAGTFRIDVPLGTNRSFSPGRFTQLRGNTAVFSGWQSANDGVDEELWKSDGTAATTARIKDIQPGNGSSSPRDLVHFNGMVYFTADDGASGRELWRTDGTAAGTVMVKDILPGAQGSAPSELKVINARLYFFAADAEGGRELWSSDGTANGTVRVADVNPGPAGSEPMNLTEVYGDVYFTANDGAGPKLYRVAAPAAGVAGRRMFYNHSALDGRDPAANAADDNAVAGDKAALLPGQTATFANVSNYFRGLNGVMIDLADRPSRTLRPEDFEVRVGNAADGSAWRVGPAPQSVSVRRLGNVDRVTLVWPDNALRNTWVEVKVRNTWNSGLAAPDVFYFGSAVGKAVAAAGATSFAVNAIDVLAVRRQLLRGRASRDSAFDFNRDGAVTAADLLVARQAWATGFALAVLSAPTPQGVR